MIRGVNKQIIEVGETGSRYFERALLFVRPEFMAADHEKLCAEAKRYIGSVGQPPNIAQKRLKRKFRRKGHGLKPVFFIAGAAFFAVCIVLFKIL